MRKYYLRLEAVNLDNFTRDTENLSAIRGGSLLLLRATDGLEGNASIFTPLRPITAGASIGMYEFEANDEQEAETVRRSVANWISQKDGLRFATFVVDVQPESPAFTRDVEALTSRNRWRQMQSASVIPDPAPSARLCEVDKIRPAVGEEWIHDKSRWVSRSVSDRYAYGRGKKQQFYREESDREVNTEFARDLDELSHDPSKGNLHHKIAIIYLDGNNFGKRKRDANDRTEWEQFDRKVKDYRRQMLGGLIDAITQDDDWRTREGRARIETLMWGGDEILWVVPAWKGWETLRHFYEASLSWEVHKQFLCHAGGIIFCHHNAPIHRLTALVQDLAGLAKENGGREYNRFGYEVFESFDHAGSDFAAYRRSRCVQPLDAGTQPDIQSLIIDAEQMQSLQELARGLREGLPRRKLHDVIEDLLEPCKSLKGEESDNRAKRLAARLQRRASLLKDFKDRLRSCDMSDSLVQEFEQRFGAESCWLHLHALWDYLIY